MRLRDISVGDRLAYATLDPVKHPYQSSNPVFEFEVTGFDDDARRVTGLLGIADSIEPTSRPASVPTRHLHGPYADMKAFRDQANAAYAERVHKTQAAGLAAVETAVTIAQRLTSAGYPATVHRATAENLIEGIPATYQITMTLFVAERLVAAIALHGASS